MRELKPRQRKLRCRDCASRIGMPWPVVRSEPGQVSRRTALANGGPNGVPASLLILLERDGPSQPGWLSGVLPQGPSGSASASPLAIHPSLRARIEWSPSAGRDLSEVRRWDGTVGRCC